MNSTPLLTQNVQCQDGYGLVNFALMRIPEDKDQPEPVTVANYLNKVAESFDSKYATVKAWDSIAKELRWVTTRGDKLSYVYSCAPIPNLKECRSVETPKTFIQHGRSYYLNRQNYIWHDPNQVISGFQMISETEKTGTGTIRYKYKVCTV